MSLMTSKPCCPMYNFAKLYIKQNYQTEFLLLSKPCCPKSKIIGLIPCRLSNGISTTRMLKHRAYLISAVKDGKRGLRSQFVARFVSTKGGIGEIWKSSARFHFYLKVLALFVAARIFGGILYWFAVLRLDKPFSIGDIIQVGSVKGKVIRMGVISTSLLTADNTPMVVPNTIFSSEAIVNKSYADWHELVSNIYLLVDENEEIHKMVEEIIDTVKSNPNIYLEGEPPYCCPSAIKSNWVELNFGCKLKNMGEGDLLSAKQDILLQLVKIIEKHGLKLDDHMGKLNTF
ncbi:unnamed protein product [Lactuca virosa]|uniref:Mechanosensitive ion channel MscS domain-containing protein n=1 Tax=Lactuca virosa TaxID=75947 RepID=A0AAU9LNM5_9ASTR|nr:unnamed protein product [Lactuca virosa]